MKFKSKVVKKTLQNKDIIETFQELLGTSENNAHLPVAHPKYLKMYSHVSRFIKLLSMFKDSNIMLKQQDIRECLSSYISSLNDSFNEDFNAPDLEQFLTKQTETLAGSNYSTIPAEIKKEFSIVFNKMKKCNIVNIIIVVCKNLLSYKKYIENKDSLSDHFLTKSAGNVISPLPDLPQFNIKKIYNDDIYNSLDKQFILMFVSKLYEISYNVYETLSSPDVDVNDFVAVILNSIDTVKKHIPRCNEAFDKIVESVDLLKNNFDDYYKDFVGSNNPAIIMENFVLDVSKNTKATPKITAQFRRIINHYRNVAGKNITDPRLKTLFKHVDKNFEALEKCKDVTTDDSYVEEDVEVDSGSESESDTASVHEDTQIEQDNEVIVETDNNQGNTESTETN